MAAASGSCFFFVQGDAPSYATARLSLALYGSTLSGVFAGVPLYLANASGDNRASGALPLYLDGSPVPVTGSLPLYLAGTTHVGTASLDLFLAQSGVSSSLNLWASGTGQNAGAVPLSGSLPLFLKRGEAEALFLYCQGPGTVASGALNLYSAGAYLASGSLNLVLPSSVGLANSTIDLYMTGW